MSGFFRGKSEEERELDRQLEIASRAFSRIDKRMEKSVKASQKALKNISSIEDREALSKELAKVSEVRELVNDLKKQGKTISKEESDRILKAYTSYNAVVIGNEKVVKALEKQGIEIEDIDISRPIKRASEELGESLGGFLGKNIEAISKTGIQTEEIGNVALRSISPELAFATEALGLNIGGIKSFFNRDKAEEGKEAELEVLEESMKNVETILNSNQEEQNDNTGKIVDAIEDTVEADNVRNEENITIADDQHQEAIEIADDIRDGQNRNSMFSGFFGKGSGKGSLLKGLLKGAGLLALGLAGAVGYAIGTLINDYLIPEDVGRMIGDFIGPRIDSIINFFKGIPSWLKEKFNSIVEFDYFGFFQKKLDDVKDFFYGIPDKITSAFKGVSEFFKDAKTKILENLGIDPNISIMDQILDAVLSPFDSLKTFFENPTESIKKYLEGPDIENGEYEEPSFTGFLKDRARAVTYSAKELIKGPDISAGEWEEPSVGGFVKDRANAARNYFSKLISDNDLKVDSMAPSANEMENSISQIRMTEAMNNNASHQERIQEKSSKEMIKIIKQQEEKNRNSSYRGMRSQDNSPVISTDTGLVLTLGGG
jgi:hypothetical protein